MFEATEGGGFTKTGPDDFCATGKTKSRRSEAVLQVQDAGNTQFQSARLEHVLHHQEFGEYR